MDNLIDFAQAIEDQRYELDSDVRLETFSDEEEEGALEQEPE